MALLPLRRKACWGFFRPKNPTASARCEPANLGTKGQHATSRPPKPLEVNVSVNKYFQWSCITINMFIVSNICTDSILEKGLFLLSGKMPDDSNRSNFWNIAFEKAWGPRVIVTSFFFYWRYNPLWVLAFSVIFFHSALSSHCFLHRLTPIICKSSSLPAIHLFRGLPLVLVPIGFHFNTLRTGSFKLLKHSFPGILTTLTL